MTTIVDANGRIIISTQADNVDETTTKLDELRDVVVDLSQNINSMGNRFNEGARNANKLVMQFLGIMFFGMAIQRLFKGMLQPAMEAFGIFDLWSTMLMVLFLPIMQEIMPLFLNLITYFMNLSEPVKKTIGIIALLGVALGTVLMTVGQLVLGLSAFGGLFSSGGILATLVGGFSATVGAIFLAIGALVAIVAFGIADAFKKNFLNIRDDLSELVSNYKGMLSSLLSFVKNIFGFIKAVITGDTDKAISSVKGAFSNLLSFMDNFARSKLNVLNIIGKGVLNIISNAITVIIDLFDRLKRRLEDSIIGKVVWAGINAAFPISNVANLPGSVRNQASSIFNINNSTTVTVANNSELDRILNQRDSALLQDIRRMVGG